MTRPRVTSNTSVRTTHDNPTATSHRVLSTRIHRIVRLLTNRINSDPLKTANCRARKSPTTGASNSVRAMPCTTSTAISSSQTAVALRMSPTITSRADQISTCSIGRRGDRGISGPQPNRTTRSGLRSPRPSQLANCRRSPTTSTGWPAVIFSMASEHRIRTRG